MLSVIYSLGSIQAFLLALFLYQSRHKLWWGNNFVALLLFCIACILSLFLARLHYGNDIPGFLFWPVVTLPTLFGPLLYAYFRSFSSTKAEVLKDFRFHLIPLLGLLLLFGPQILAPISEGVSHIDEVAVKQKIMLASYIKSLVIMSYLVVCLRLVFDGKLKDGISASSLQVMQYLLVLFLLVAVFGSVLSTLYWTGIYVSPLADYLELSFLTLLSYLLSIYILVTHLSPLHPKVRYNTTNLADSTRKSLAEQLKNLMEKEKTFTDERYSAKYLCQKLGVTEQNLSELLALEFDQNFYDFSNQFRLNYFKLLVIQQPDKNLLELSELAGFKSKSSFNRVIKSLTGLTPSQLKQQLYNP